jgi:acetylornithine/succinyldiaminopimelate/putrescine aminotransferase
MVAPSGAPPSPRAGEALEKYGASESDSFLMDRNLNDTPHRIIRSKGSILLLDNGQEIFDGSCGAAVSCIGHGDEDVIEAIVAQHRQLSYCHSMWFGTTSASKLGEELIRGTDNKMSRAFIVCSGSLSLTYSPTSLANESPNIRLRGNRGSYEARLSVL